MRSSVHAFTSHTDTPPPSVPQLVTAVGVVAATHWDAASPAVTQALRVLSPLLSACSPAVQGSAPAAGQAQAPQQQLSEPLRAAVAGAIARLGDCMRAAAGADAGSGNSPGRQRQTEATSLCVSAFDMLRSPTWLDDPAKVARHAGLDAVGSLASVIPADHLAASLPNLHPALLACLRRENDPADRLHAARALARVLSAAAATDTLEPSIASTTVSAIVTHLGAGTDAAAAHGGEEDDSPAATAARNCHSQLLQACGVCASARPGETVTSLLKTLDASNAGTPGHVAPACGAFAALRHVATASSGTGAAGSAPGGAALAPRRDAVLATLRACASGERDPRVRKALAQAVLALAPLGYLTQRGGWDLVLFLVRCAAITDAEVAAFRSGSGSSSASAAVAAATAVGAALTQRRTHRTLSSASFDADAVAPDELRRLGERALALLAGTLPVAEPALWPGLLACITSPSLTGAVPPIARACCVIIKRRETKGDGLGVVLAVQSAQTAGNGATQGPPTGPQLLARCLVLLHAPHRRGGPGTRLLELLGLLGPAVNEHAGPVLAQQAAALTAQLTSTSSPGAVAGTLPPSAGLQGGWRTAAASAAWDSALLRLTRDVCRAVIAGGGPAVGDAFVTALCDSLTEQRPWYAADSQLSGAQCAQLGAAAACLARPLDVTRRLDALWSTASLERPDERRGVASACGALAAAHPGLVCSKLAAVASSAKKAATPPARPTNRFAAFFSGMTSPVKGSSAPAGDVTPPVGSPSRDEVSNAPSVPSPDASFQHTSGVETPQERLAAVGLAIGAAARGMPGAAVATHLDAGICGPLVPLFPLATTAVAKAALARAAHAAAAAASQAAGGAVPSTLPLPRRDALLFGVLSLVDAAQQSGSSGIDTVSPFVAALSAAGGGTASAPHSAASVGSAVFEVRPGCLGAPPQNWPDGSIAGVLAACLPALSSLLLASGNASQPGGAPPLHLQSSCFALALRVLAAFGTAAMEAVPLERCNALRVGCSAVLCAALTSVTVHAIGGSSSINRHSIHPDALAALLIALDASASSRDVDIHTRAAVLRATADVLRHARNNYGGSDNADGTAGGRPSLRMGLRLGPLLPYIAHPNIDVARAAAEAAGALLSFAAAAGSSPDGSLLGSGVDDVAEARGALARCGATPRDASAAAEGAVWVPTACDVSFRLAVVRTAHVLLPSEAADYMASAPGVFSDCGAVSTSAAVSCACVAKCTAPQIWAACPEAVTGAVRAMLRAAAKAGYDSAGMAGTGQWHAAVTALTVTAPAGDESCFAALLSVATETSAPAGFAAVTALTSNPGDGGRLARSLLRHCTRVLLTAPRTPEATAALAAVSAAGAYGHDLLASDEHSQLRAAAVTAVLCACGAGAAGPSPVLPPPPPPSQPPVPHPAATGDATPSAPENAPPAARRRSDALLAHAEEHQGGESEAETADEEPGVHDRDGSATAGAPAAVDGGGVPPEGASVDALGGAPTTTSGAVLSALRLLASCWGDETLALAVEDCAGDMDSAASGALPPLARLGAATSCGAALASAVIATSPNDAVRQESAHAMVAACAEVVTRGSSVAACGGEAAVAACIMASVCCAYTGADAAQLVTQTARSLSLAVSSHELGAAAPGFRAASMRGLATLLSASFGGAAATAAEDDAQRARHHHELSTMVLQCATDALGDGADSAVVAAAAEAVRDCLSVGAVTAADAAAQGVLSSPSAHGGAVDASLHRLVARLCDAALGCGNGAARPWGVRLSATHALTAWLCADTSKGGDAGGPALPAVDTPNATRLVPGLLMGAGSRHPPLRNASLTALRALLTSAAGANALFHSNEAPAGRIVTTAADFDALLRQLPPSLHATLAPQLYGDMVEFTADALADALKGCRRQGKGKRVGGDSVEAAHAAVCAGALLGSLLAALPVGVRREEHLALLTDAATDMDLGTPAAVRARALSALAGLVVAA
jgi:hypothetical protein